MLEMRSQCEKCNKKLLPTDRDVYICSHECTFCENCVETVLQHVCPNCGGNFEKRPTRIAKS